MVGFCGIFGNPEFPIRGMSQKLFYISDEESHKYRNENLEIELVLFSKSAKEKNIGTEYNNLFWVWGDIYGYEHEGKYLKKENKTSDSEYLSSLYNKYGDEIFRKLNGEFAAVKYDIDKKKLSLITDKLSTHPIFFTKTESGNLVFSTNIQSIPLYPEIETTFELKYLAQFLAFERVLGVKTPLEGIEQVHPGAIMDYELSKKDCSRNVYWTPHYDPKKRSYSKIIEEFTSLFKDVIRNRIDSDLSYGLFLSGGSDSRLILATINDIYPNLDLTCFHMNEFMNKEAKISKRVAKECDFDFEFLKREKDYQKKVLENSSPISIYSSWFDHAHQIGFKEKIKDEVDIILNGSYSNTIIGRGHLPKKRIKIPIFNEFFYLPKFETIKSLEDFVELYLSLEGLAREGVPIEKINEIDEKKMKFWIDSEIKRKKNSIICHGVVYPSLNSFFQTFGFYPITNAKGYLVHYSDCQMIRSIYPFFDDRLISYSFSLPEYVFLRRHVINSGIKNISPIMAKIPHAGSGLSLEQPKLLHSFKGQFNMAKQKLFPSQKWQGSWGNVEELIRKTDFTKNKISRNKELIEKCEFLDWSHVKKCYEEHMSGKNNKNEIVALLTFLENPTTKYILLGENYG